MSTQAKIPESKKSCEIFTCIPQDVSRIEYVRRLKNEETLKTYKAICIAFEKGSGHDLEEIKKKIEAVDPMQRLKPSLHSVVHQAGVAMRTGDALGCYRALKWIDEEQAVVGHPGILVQAPNNSPASAEAIQHMHNDPTRDVHGRRAEIYKTSEEELVEYRADIKQVLDTIKILDPLMYDEMLASVSEATVFRAQALMGGSLIRTFGAIYIGSPDHDPIRKKFGEHFNIRGVPYFMEHVVHETSHNVLFGLMLVDPMVLNPITERYSAPLRTDLRPMYGIFHASFVISRMLRIFRLMKAGGGNQYERLISHFEPRLKNGLEILAKHGNLTASGKQMFETFAPCAGI
ncbi:hypothetical protein EJP67_07710 [Variovorax guangxiensis]|uniref:HEXXH motif domain-containing protein n=1 Tax=Variovorax guangxiensis TaxID=1775474 RepID=A0A433MH07_9BURK|nr:HEXXH motif-containing putative peptide modification protein [Variovorax guangxiensis]RUR66950.1 hypothetical protein EJP67_07710 [Variovorax guangxiensis]